MKKFTKSVLSLIGLGTIIGGAFVYLKDKGYITVSSGNDDEDYDDFSDEAYKEETERTYIHVDTDAMKKKAKEVASEVAEDIKDKAEDVYDDARKKAGDAASNIANALEKAWYEAGEQAEKVEEFFNDET